MCMIYNHTRLTLALAVFMLVFTVVSQILSHGQGYWPFLVNRWGWDLTTVQQGRIYFAWTGLFFATARQNFYGVLLLMLIAMGALEYRHSTIWAALRFFRHRSDCQYYYINAALADRQRRHNICASCSLHTGHGSFNCLLCLPGHPSYE